jgi:transcriptional regulator with XRE-family HTH domain
MQQPQHSGFRLRELRLTAHMSVAELAARSGVNKGTISRIEGGKTPNPRYDTVQRLTSVLGQAIKGSGPAPINAAHDGLNGSPDLSPPSPARSGVLSNVVGRLEDLRGPEARLLPIYRWGSCGDPRDRESSPDPDSYDYPPPGTEHVVGPGGFGVVVKGDSMTSRRINDGDTVWINPATSHRQGRPVAARVWSVDDSEVGMVIKVWANLDGVDRLWNDSDAEDGRSPVECSRFDVLGPVVMITPKSYPPL